MPSRNRSVTQAAPGTPVHVLSTLVTIILYVVTSMPEVVVPISLPLTMATALVLCGLSVTLTQWFVAGDSFGAALAKGLAMGILAAVPYLVVGTSAGAVLLAWAGYRSVTQALPSGRKRSS